MFTRVYFFVKKVKQSFGENHVYIWDTANKSHIILLSHSLPIDTQSMAFLGETSSQTIVNSRLGFIFSNGSIIHNDSGVYFQTSTLVPIQVHNTLQLTDKQFLDEIHYRQPFTHTGNQIRFQCMQLINDDDINTMLMCNDQFLCVGPLSYYAPLEEQQME